MLAKVGLISYVIMFETVGSLPPTYLYQAMQDLKQRIQQRLEPLLEETGLELVEAQLAGMGGNSIVRIYVDRAGGVSIDQCARLSEKISDLLDAEDLIPHRYTLEVSSPGLDRPLKTKADFQRKKGEKVRLFLKDKTDRRNQVSGTISSVIEEELVLSTPSQELKIPLDLIEKALIQF